MKTINTKRVGDSFVPDDMDPYSEYVHTVKEETVKENAKEEQVVAPIEHEQAMKNFNEFLNGVDAMSNVLFELLKRFR